jgi:hypothetical protein
MRRNDPNLAQLRAIAEALGDLCEQVVFVGGATAGLLLTDPLAESVRPTVDVDAIVEASGLTQFQRIEAAVASRGFARDVDSDVICRWQHRLTGLILDLMPVEAHVLGFANRWYADAAHTAIPADLGNGLKIRMISAPAFMATKLEAFASRGAGDILASHDLEDVLNVVDGREELAAELELAPEALSEAVRDAIGQLLVHPDFGNALPGLIPDPGRSDVVLTRLRKIAKRE